MLTNTVLHKTQEGKFCLEKGLTVPKRTQVINNPRTVSQGGVDTT